VRITLANLLPEDGDLGVLAVQAEDRSSSDVGMVDVARNESAKIVGIFASSSAPTFREEEFDTVDVFKRSDRGRIGTGFRQTPNL